MKCPFIPALILPPCFALFPALAAAQWFPAPVPPGVDMLLGMDFRGPRAVAGGWTAFGDFHGRGIYSTDGGTTWQMAQVPDSTRALVAMTLLDSEHGFCAGAVNVVSARSKGLHAPRAGGTLMLPRGVREFAERLGISASPGTRASFLTTSDGGTSWRPVGTFPDSITYLTGMEFVNDRRGYVSASIDPGVARAGVLRTTDGGLHWTPLPIPDGVISLRSPSFSDSLTGLVPGYAFSDSGAQSVLLRTTDGGDHWTSTTFAAIDNFTAVAFSAPDTAYASGPLRDVYAPMLLKTADAGITWAPLSFSPESVFIEGLITLPGKQTVLGVGSRFSSTVSWIPYIARTTDGGATWARGEITGTFPATLLYSGVLANDDEGFACGGNFGSPALLLHTTNGGVTFLGDDDERVPTGIRLYQNYPNPFNPTTTIEYNVGGVVALSGAHFSGVEGRASTFVRLVIYDMLGREVATLVDEMQEAGYHAVDFDGGSLASGVYIYRLQTGSFATSRKMMLVK